MAGDGLRRRLFGRARRAASAPTTASSDTPTVDLLMPVLEAIEDPLLLVEGTEVRHANRPARLLFGTHVQGDDVRLALRHPAAAGVLAGAEDGPIEVQGLGGRERQWRLAARPLGGRFRLLHLVDHSANRAAERMRVDFVANASHELRTPLSSLIGFIETLEEANRPADAQTRLRFLKIMDVEARRMQRLIDDLMSLSRIEADRYVAPRERVDLTGVVTSVVNELRTGPGGERIRLGALPEAAAWAAGDAGQLAQMTTNVIANALKYGRPGTPVTVTLARGEQAFRLQVADEGEGIAPEHLPRLTERFYRVDPGRSRDVGGTGLGLAIVKHIVERHRGRLEIASVLGQGTTITISIPVAVLPT